jgi:[1-hydroxy-2-(trimethylamino)ethyl]phosphonate dioxygenase
VSPIDTIFEILRTAGHRHYGESAVSQFEHAVQCAMLAECEGASPALVTAALLHDFGHLVNPDDHAATQRREDCRHEEIGANALGRWFGTAVTLPVRLHVPAKRYLTATDPAYAASLSAGSALSLELQGGPFRPGAARRFAAKPGAAEAIRLRRWDEAAKVRGAAIPDLEHFRPHLASCLEPAVETVTQSS